MARYEPRFVSLRSLNDRRAASIRYARSRYGGWVLPADTERLRFREMTLDDLDAMAGLLGDAEVMRYYPHAKSRDEARGWIAWNQRNYAEHGCGLWIIETIDREFVGDCGLTWQKVNGIPALEVGYHVAPRWQGRGLATEAAVACRDFARAVLGEAQLVAIIHPENRASERVAEKIGMTRMDDDLGGALPVRRVFGMRLQRAAPATPTTTAAARAPTRRSARAERAP